MIQAQIQVTVGIETLDPLRCRPRPPRAEVVLIGPWERVAVSPIQIRARSSPSCSISASWKSSDHVRVGLGQSGLDRCDVVVARGSRVRANDRVESRQHGLRDARAEIGALPAEGVLEDLLDAPTDVGVVPLEREVDEAGEEPAKRVASHEETDPPPLAEVEDPERDVVELVLLIWKSSSRG